MNEEQLKNLPIQSEEIAFKPEEMISCGKCTRKNPPNRLKCVYCGVELELSDVQAEKLKPTLRKLENWEKGFNLIYLQGSPTDEKLTEIAKITRLEKKFLSKIFDSQKKLPIVRLESNKECEILQKNFQNAGVETSIVSDEFLAAENLPKRLRGLEFADGKLTLILFNNDEIVQCAPEDLTVIVSGAIFQKAIESTEKRKKGESKILNASETASDEFLFDFYTKNDSNGFRILTKGFDFSCLGAEKGILARENLQKLIVKLKDFAPNACIVNDYLAVREHLGEVWEVEQRKDPLGLKRQSFGKFDFANIASSSNESQFTKYSRLQCHLI